ncbi:MMPL family transporter [Micromonospora sp. WMMA1998]|uniref:MMPL family transporter n=1 Tax=Micromonospora sp. WMMA1998 TaxID=3015167 RepID=UPI00248B974D|nr:MMPL family transporter [Micromonospora sp. WMMA1998]WBC16373.1 MMPL family transporter [Micromonospora sp. WMMA1998]
MRVDDGSRVHRLMGGLGRLCARRPRTVLGVWLILAVLLVGAAAALGRPVDNDVALPGSDAQVARGLLDRAGQGGGTGGQLVLHVDSGRLDDAARQGVLAQVSREIAEVPHVTGVDGIAAAAGTLSADGRTGWLTVRLDVSPRQVNKALAGAVTEAAAPAEAAGIEVTPGGVLASAAERGGSRDSEVLGLAVAALVLLVAFGGLVAAAVPLVTALFTLACAVSAVGLAGHLVAVPSVAGTLATMVGLGVGIDYALFLVTRHRRLLAEGVPVDEAVARSVAGSGSAVVFAGGTVVVALGGLAVAGVPVLGTLGWTTGLVVVVAVAGAVTLLPALLAVLGHRLDRLRIRRRPSAPDGTAAGRRSGWARQADRVTGAPLRWAILALLLLGVLTAPALGLRLGQVDPGDEPVGTAGRTSYDRLAAGFGPGVNGPLTVVAELDPPADAVDARVNGLTARVTATPGVARVTPARPADGGRVVVLTAYPTTAPSDPATAALVRTLRAVDTPGVTTHVGGATATRVDLADRVGQRMPWVIAVVVGLATALLYAAFRAPVVAVKAAVMNLVSIGAAYGVLTAVFAWGWGVGLTGLSGPVPVESYLPMMLFALLFGLSMDYEVFLLTAVRESWLVTGDNRTAVREGLAGTGPVITSAALIMVTVFAGFVLQDDPVIKMFGLGMAVAVAVDATVVRGLLVPATMALLGRANWWRPGRSDRRPDQAPPRVPVG